MKKKAKVGSPGSPRPCIKGHAALYVPSVRRLASTSRRRQQPLLCKRLHKADLFHAATRKRSRHFRLLITNHQKAADLRNRRKFHPRYFSMKAATP